MRPSRALVTTALAIAAGLLSQGWSMGVGPSSAFAQAKPEAKAQAAQPTPAKRPPAARPAQAARVPAKPAPRPASRRATAARAGADRPASSSPRGPRTGQLEQRDVPATPAPATLGKGQLETVKPPTVVVTRPAAVERRPVLDELRPPPDAVVALPHISRADLDLRDRVKQALAKDTALTYSARGVQVDAQDGEVTLQGTLASQFEKARVARTAARVAGVQSVNDKLTLRNAAGARGGRPQR